MPLMCGRANVMFVTKIYCKFDVMKVVLIGGFLGSGKTTAIINACGNLQERGLTVAVITNDQGDQQVDTSFVRSNKIAGSEVLNGCFCCNYKQFDAELATLVNSHNPDYIFAEAVGSCTDLVATIAAPLGKFRPGVEVVITVFVDAALLLSVIEGRASFIDETVRYIFRKQIEEADLLVINKSDTITSGQFTVIQVALATENNGKMITFQNSTKPTDIMNWLELLSKVIPANRKSLVIDYDLYGAGETKLTWADKSFTILSPTENAVFITRYIIGKIIDHLQEQRLFIGHLKCFLESAVASEKISITTTSTSAHFKSSIPETRQLNVLLNARVQTIPETLAAVVEIAMAGAKEKFGCEIKVSKEAVFTPGKPVPTYRFESPAE
jgi:Ni2+-binding GTPase involved in maturation of urease and hydrogenase